MKTVLYFQPQTKRSDSLKLEGAKQAARRLGWRTMLIESLPTAEGIEELVSSLRPAGAIVECDGWGKAPSPAVFAPLKTVFVDPPPEIRDECEFSVGLDFNVIGREAARHLVALGRENFAYVPFKRPVYWSDMRQRGFAEELAAHGFKCRTLSAGPSGEKTPQLLRRRRKFLESLKLPCALFAANDETAESVISLAGLAGIKIPDDLVVLGVDNYTPICENTQPTLSSIEPDFYRSGELAMILLAAASRYGGRFRGRKHLTSVPARTVVRTSTRAISTAYEPAVARAVEFIRGKACLGLRAEDVVKMFPCSAPLAHARFKKATGRTILEEIHAVQLENAKRLLSNPNQQLKSISDFCGFTNPNSLRKFFLRETGMTMSQWREENLRPSVESERL